MAAKHTARETVPVDAARRLLLAGALLHRAPRVSSRARALEVVHALGFVQLDSIRAVERAHDLTMHARLERYQPAHLQHHLEGSRALFEHWTHDASLIRADWLPWWQHRFERDRARLQRNAWLRERLGAQWRPILDEVRLALRERAPVSARDFPRPARAREGWWDWSPHKAALELLWRTGEAAVHSRRNFEKRYASFAEIHGAIAPAGDRRALVDWACAQALERLGTATPRELAHFLRMIRLEEAREWCVRAARDGHAEAVRLERIGRTPAMGVALPDWRRRAAAIEPPELARALTPFDPLTRERDRLAQLFGFHYRFEAFVPAAKRVHGYYTMPVLLGDRLIGRIDATADRAACVLRVERWWCETRRCSAADRRAMRAACERLAAQLGLECTLPRAAPSAAR